MSLIATQTNMITQQIRAEDVTDEKVLKLFERIERAAFVNPTYQDLAYADMMLPIGCEQVMLAPNTQAKMLQALKIQPHETVLEIGTGNGFFTALLTQLAHHVTSVEIHQSLSNEAAQHLQRLAIGNVALQVGNGAQGWRLDAPADIIVITGSLPFVPASFKACMKAQGRLMAILGTKPATKKVVLIKQNLEGGSTKKDLFETDVPELEKATQAESFVF
jgi:protein-L-isoaspartate(D-aspartate) O-methyltransferase